MEDASEESRQELSELNENLLDERERVDEALERVESATEENWSDVREGARNTFQDVKREFGELGDRLSD
jgi:chromosome segregation ATPase